MNAIEKGLDDIFRAVDKVTGRVDGIEKTLVRLDRTNDVQDVLRKALMDGRGSAGVIGTDGCDTLGLLRTTGGVHQKSLGWGSFLGSVARAQAPQLFNVTNLDRIQKNLDSMGSRLVSKTPLAEGSGATGGYTVPIQFYADLLRLVAEDSFMRQLCTVMPMQSKTMYIPALAQASSPVTGTSAFFGGVVASWQPEAASINEAEPAFRQIQLTARDLVFYTVASNQLLQDNAVALDTLLTTLFKEAMAWFYDYYILRGVGSDQPLGILNAPATFLQARTVASHFRIQDVANMMSHLLPSSWKSAVWVVHPSVLQDLITMADSTNGRLVWVNQFGDAGRTSNAGPMALAMPMTILGRPVYVTEKVPSLGTTGDVMLIDASKYVVGDRLAIQVETSPHVKFLNNQMVWRIIARWDGQPWVDAPVILADGSGTYKVSPFVALQ